MSIYANNYIIDEITGEYNRMKEKPKFKGKDRDFWMSTLGIDVDLINGIL